MTGVPPNAAILRAMPPACRAGRVTRMPRPPSGPARGVRGWAIATNLPRDESRGAASEEISGERASESVGRRHIIAARALVAAQDFGPVAAREQPAQPQFAV